MNITLDKKIHQALTKASHFAGLDEQELAERAILLYLESFQGLDDLEDELHAWQELGGISLRASEEPLGAIT